MGLFGMHPVTAKLIAVRAILLRDAVMHKDQLDWTAILSLIKEAVLAIISNVDNVVHRVINARRVPQS